MAPESAALDVQAGRVVTLEYTVHLESGRLIDSTGACGPLAVMYGSEQLFPPLEARIAGMVAGETRELRIPPEEAYGSRRDELIRTMPRDRIPPGVDLVVGEEYTLRADGKTLRFRVLGLTETAVTADFNPPQAGQALVAKVTVVSVREPTAEESRRGRV
jgi:FKBP-type peptidyl-prolyl cis-trans isomerase 2